VGCLLLLPTAMSKPIHPSTNAWVWIPTFGFLYYECYEHNGLAIGWVTRHSTKGSYTAIYSDGRHYHRQYQEGPLGYSFAYARKFVTDYAKRYGKI
jgi:hypothetical protein